MKRAHWLWSLFAVLSLVIVFTLRAQQATGHANDFTSVEYYEAPNQQQVKTRLSGAEAAPQTGGLLVIKQLKLETYDVDGKPQLVVEAPDCVYDMMKGVANSPAKCACKRGMEKSAWKAKVFCGNKPTSCSLFQIGCIVCWKPTWKLKISRENNLPYRLDPGRRGSCRAGADAAAGIAFGNAD
ncbi:MAG: hypothetical protein WDM76_19760 [Limisphaerales bacterium]